LFRLSFDSYLGIGGIVLTIILLVLDKAGKLKGPVLLVLLGVAAVMTLPLALGAPWMSDASSAMLRFSRGMLLFFLVGLAYSLLAVWISGQPENIPKANLVNIAPSPPDVKFDAYIQPGSNNPYPPETIIGGITWDPNYVDVRLDIGAGPVPIQNLNFEVTLDTSIAGVGQISQFNGVTSFPNSEAPSVSLIGTDEAGNPVTMPIVPRKGLAQIAPVYRVHCDALYGNTVLHLVIASIALNPMKPGGGLPDRLFAPRRAPRLIELKGSYEAASQRFPLEFRNVFLPEETRGVNASGPSTTALPSHKQPHRERREQASPPVTVNNAPQGIAISGGQVGSATVNNFGPPPLEVKWKAEPVTTTNPEFAYETRVTVSVNTDYTPVSLAFMCDTEISDIHYDLGPAASVQLNAFWGTAKDDTKIGLVKFGGTPMSPDTPLYVSIWSKEPLHVLRVIHAKIR
jgi:hypothetical protein